MSTRNDGEIDAARWSALRNAADRQRDRAYCPYSGYRVGAAVLTGSGSIFAGANVENASWGLTICAERAALVTAWMAGESQFRAMAVVTEDGIAPCGACRQFLAEFGQDLLIGIFGNRAGDSPVIRRLDELLPLAFDGRSLRKNVSPR